MASGAYQSFKKGLLDRATVSIDLDTDTLNVLLTVGDQAANLQTHDFRNDITDEVTGTNYASGGIVLASKTVTASGGVATFDAADSTFTNVTIAALRGAVVYKVVGTAATDPLALYFDLGAQTVTAANLVVQWNAGGLLTLT